MKSFLTVSPERFWYRRVVLQEADVKAGRVVKLPERGVSNDVVHILELVHHLLPLPALCQQIKSLFFRNSTAHHFGKQRVISVGQEKTALDSRLPRQIDDCCRG